MTVRQDQDHDYDWLVIGSGFGGSVAALRLSEKGHRVAVMECGRRFGDDDLPRSTWDVRRYFYAPPGVDPAAMREGFAKQIPKRVAIEFTEVGRVSWDHRKLGGTY